MAGRRSDPRVVVIPAAQGILRLLRDVVVQHVEDGEAVAISRSPGTKGEVLTIEMPMGPEVGRLECRVVESVPLVVGGSLRHRLRLTVVAHRTDPIPQPVPPRTDLG